MKQIHKEYTRAFLLEKTKLDRLMDIIHGLLGEHKDTATRDDFEVFRCVQLHIGEGSLSPAVVDLVLVRPLRQP